MDMIKCRFIIAQKEVLGLALIMLPLFCYLLSQLVFFVGYHQTIVVPLMSICFCMVFIYRSTRLFGGAVSSVALFCLIVVLCLIVATCLWDRSFDGTWYHADIQYQLAENNYNPIYQWELTDNEMLAGARSFLWSNHYPKGIEIISSCWVVLTHNLESGKATNLFFVIGCFLLLDSFVSSFSSSPKRLKKYVFLFVAIGNPVVLNQMLTNYIDWTSYVFLFIALICAYKMLLYKDRKYEFTLYMMLALVINVKINIAFWVCLLTMCFMIALVFVYRIEISKFVRKLFFYTTLSIALGFFIAFNPYITNYCMKGNALYPLTGKDKIDIIAVNIPIEISGDDAFLMVNKALLMKPWMQEKYFPNPTSAKAKIFSLGDVDSRLGGFGVFFFEATLILLILSFFTKVKFKYKMLGLFGVLLLYLSLFMLPAGWWARYVAYFYLCPIVLITLCYYANRSANYRLFFYFAVLLLVVNSGLSLITSFYSGIANQRNSVRVLSYLEKIDTKGLRVQTPNALFCEKLRARGIVYCRDNVLKEDKSFLVGGAPVYFEGIVIPSNLLN